LLGCGEHQGLGDGRTRGAGRSLRWAPLGFDRRGAYGLDLNGSSAAQHAQELLPDASVVGAFHHLSAVSPLGNALILDHEDVLVCGHDDGAKQQVIELASTITGPRHRRGSTSTGRPVRAAHRVRISINKRYKVRSGIPISGLNG
jgi:predicted dinucleotide-binding enzyme